MFSHLNFIFCTRKAKFLWLSPTKICKIFFLLYYKNNWYLQKQCTQHIVIFINQRILFSLLPIWKDSQICKIALSVLSLPAPLSLSFSLKVYIEVWYTFKYNKQCNNCTLFWCSSIWYMLQVSPGFWLFKALITYILTREE